MQCLSYFFSELIKKDSKPITIQGTNLTLDNPEDLQAWLAERKKRWPTAVRTEDKKRKMEDALARGQLSISDMSLNHRKRQRTEESGGRGQFARGQGQRGRGRGRGTDRGWSGRRRSPGPDELKTSKPPGLNDRISTTTNTIDVNGGEDDAPEVVTSKRRLEETIEAGEKNISVKTHERSVLPRKPERTPLQPKKEPYNPFATRPTLLRNVCSSI